MTVESSPQVRPQAVPAVEISRRALLLGGLGALLAGCDLLYESWEWNQRLTIEVETPEGLKTGSAVSYAYWREGGALEANYGTDYAGEATVVEVTPGQYLIAIIGEHTKYIAQYTFHGQFGVRRGDYEKLFPLLDAYRGKANVPRRSYPRLVYFRDPNDPLSIRQVDPDDLAATFGEGVRLRGITLELTDDPVTKGEIAKVLPWLAAIGDARKLDGDRYATASAKHRLANDLSKLDFAKEHR